MQGVEELHAYSTVLVSGETPKHAAYHAASQCFILLTEKSGDLKSLHLVDPSSLKPLTSMGLDPSHYPCGVLVAALPCSSSLFDDNGNVLDKKTPWKEFVIVWSYVMLDEGKCHGQNKSPTKDSLALHITHNC